MPFRLACGIVMDGMLAKGLAVSILVFSYGMILSEKINRTSASLVGAVLVVAAGLVKAEDIFNEHGVVHWDALLLIFGMFVLVEVLSETGFFRYVGVNALKFTKFNPVKVFVMFSALTAFLAAFMDSITVMIFMATLTIEVCKVIKMSPVPFILGEITSANIGGSATMVGDPPNIIIGTALQYNFMDFAQNTGVIAVAVFIVNVTFFLIYYRKFFASRYFNDKEFSRLYTYLYPPSRSYVKDMPYMKLVLSVFIFTVALLVVHHIIHISVAFIGVIGATLVLLFGGKKAMESAKKLDWNTLVFFGGLFVIVGGLEKSGVTTEIANGIGTIAGGNEAIIVTLILWLGFIISAFVDNVPFAAAMIPVIKSISATYGCNLETLAWATALTADIGGNATPIGASANVVALAVAEEKGINVKWKDFIKVALPATILSMLTINIVMWIRYLA